MCARTQSLKLIAHSIAESQPANYVSDDPDFECLATDSDHPTTAGPPGKSERLGFARSTALPPG